MRRLGALSILIAALAVSALAQSGSTFEQISTSTSPASIAASTLEPAGYQPPLQCDVRVEFTSVRYRVDGGTATASSGMPLLADVDTLRLSPAQAKLFSVHGAGATPSRTAQVNVRCW